MGMALAKDVGSFQKTCLGEERDPVILDDGFPALSSSGTLGNLRIRFRLPLKVSQGSRVWEISPGLTLNLSAFHSLEARSLNSLCR